MNEALATLIDRSWSSWKAEQDEEDERFGRFGVTLTTNERRPGSQERISAIAVTPPRSATPSKNHESDTPLRRHNSCPYPSRGMTGRQTRPVVRAGPACLIGGVSQVRSRLAQLGFLTFHGLKQKRFSRVEIASSRAGYARARIWLLRVSCVSSARPSSSSSGGRYMPKRPR